MHIGQSTPRKEGRSKITGQARYVDDLALPGMLHGVTVRSHCSRGVIRDIRFDASIPWDEFTIVTAADIPGANVVALITDDQPCLADGRVNHAAEPVVLLAHPDRSLLDRARAGRLAD
jgi:CO/xanthine dehydrogenase Mo-binding subunit